MDQELETIEIDFGDLPKAVEVGLVSQDEEPLMRHRLIDEAMANREIGNIQNARPNIQKMLEDAEGNLARAKVELPNRVIDFGMTGDRKPLTAHRTRMSQLENLISDCRAALKTLQKREESGFLKAFTHANMVRDRIRCRLQDWADKQSKG